MMQCGWMVRVVANTQLSACHGQIGMQQLLATGNLERSGRRRFTPQFAALASSAHDRARSAWGHRSANPWPGPAGPQVGSVLHKYGNRGRTAPWWMFRAIVYAAGRPRARTRAGRCHGVACRRSPGPGPANLHGAPRGPWPISPIWRPLGAPRPAPSPGCPRAHSLRAARRLRPGARSRTLRPRQHGRGAGRGPRQRRPIRSRCPSPGRGACGSERSPPPTWFPRSRR